MKKPHLLSAVLTRSERLDAEVDSHVLGEIGAVGERLDALKNFMFQKFVR